MLPEIVFIYIMIRIVVAILLILIPACYTILYYTRFSGRKEGREGGGPGVCSR